MHDSTMGYGCTPHRIGHVLIIIGGLNWGLVGLGMLMNSMDSWNVIHMLLRSAPMLEAIVYLLVGVAAVMAIFRHKCKRCMSCMNGSCGHDNMMDKKM